MDFDYIDKIENTTLQHGKLCNRVYIMSIDSKNTSRILEIAENLTKSHKYTKIIAKVPERSVKEFLANDYIVEAKVPDMYHGVETGYFMCKYFDQERMIDQDQQLIEDILKDALVVSTKSASAREKDDVNIRKVKKMKNKDVKEMTQLYSRVFETYPFPITDKNYLVTTMLENMDYYGIRIEGKLVALASAVIDMENNFAELTDFAVAKEYRQQGLARQLLETIEDELKDKNILTYFTTARAKSPAINKSFSNLGYTHAGTLVNNTNIAGSIESMNVWYKNVKQKF